MDNLIKETVNSLNEIFNNPQWFNTTKFYNSKFPDKAVKIARILNDIFSSSEEIHVLIDSKSNFLKFRVDSYQNSLTEETNQSISQHTI